ncbi:MULTISPECIES: ATP-dependent zinc protease family protein [unclassified Agarivorans]|uniref:ATP-dependent zinc protease family protein n=1 Tax=unclassified Agarivorans TaxID=2636026 RepID=UPI003D7C5545
MSKMIIGNLETCHLPDLGIHDLPIRVDTGAQTSSLHVDNVERIKVNGKPHISFDLHPDIYNLKQVCRCTAPIFDTRRIKSSNGVVEQRYVIQTNFQLGDLTWPIEITLTNRQDMSYLMLFGRQGMADKVLVDPSQSFLVNSIS